jgi:hypothetical protein
MTHQMSDSVKFEPLWVDSQLVLIAYYGSNPSRSIGEARGSVEENGVGLLSDILLENEIEVSGGFLGMFKKKIQIRGKGIGTQLLASFEQEMDKKGVVMIQGNLVPEEPKKLEWLIAWYRDHGYEFRPGETVGAWVPPNTAGVVSKILIS